MSSKELKYKKRAWHKVIAKVYSVEQITDRLVQIIVYKGDKKIALSCFTNDREKLLSMPPHKKLYLWFSLKSKEYSGRWYHDVYLMHFEDAKEENTGNPKFTDVDKGYANDIFQGNFGNEDFESDL